MKVTEAKPAIIQRREPGVLPRIGTIEFLIHGQCEECGWRCAVPGEGQMWPLCPVCNKDLLEERADSVVLPKRGKTEDDPPYAHAYVGVFLEERQAHPAFKRYLGPITFQMGFRTLRDRLRGRS